MQVDMECNHRVTMKMKKPHNRVRKDQRHWDTEKNR